MNKTKNFIDVYTVIRICIYIIQFVVLFAIQQIPGFIPEIYGGRPNLILPLLFSVSLFEGNYLSLIWGLISGAILDFSLSKYMGIQLFIMGVLGYILGKIKEKLFAINIYTFIVCCAVTEPLIIFMNFYLNYNASQSEYMNLMLNYHIIPGIIYTFFISPIVYLFNRPIFYLIKKKEGG